MNLNSAIDTIKSNTLSVDSEVIVPLDNKDNPNRKKEVINACKFIGEFYAQEAYVL